MSKSVEDLYELVKALEAEELILVEGSFTKKGNSHSIALLKKLRTIKGSTRQLTTGMDKTQKNALIKLAGFLYDKIIEVLRQAAREQPAMKLSEDLEVLHVLSQRNLHRQASELLPGIKEKCLQNNWLYSLGVAIHNEVSVGNYVPGVDLIELAKSVVQQNDANFEVMLYWKEAFHFYLNAVISQKMTDLPHNEKQLFPIKEYMQHKLFSKNTSKDPLFIAAYVEKAKALIYFEDGDVKNAARVEKELADRFRKEQGATNPLGRYNWLIDRIKIHEATGDLVEWKKDIEEMQKLYTLHFKGDKMKRSFLLRSKLSYQTQVGKKADLSLVIYKSIDFFENMEGHTYDQPIVSFLAELMVSLFQSGRFPESLHHHDIFYKNVKQKELPDYQTFIRVFKVFITWELKGYKSVVALSKSLNYFYNNNFTKEDDYAVERIVSTCMGSLAKLEPEKNIENDKIAKQMISLLTKLSDEIKALVKRNHINAIYVTSLFPIDKWANEKIINLQGQKR